MPYIRVSLAFSSSLAELDFGLLHRCSRKGDRVISRKHDGNIYNGIEYQVVGNDHPG
jgi:hypothetical protein